MSIIPLDFTRKSPDHMGDFKLFEITRIHSRISHFHKSKIYVLIPELAQIVQLPKDPHSIHDRSTSQRNNTTTSLQYSVSKTKFKVPESSMAESVQYTYIRFMSVVTISIGSVPRSAVFARVVGLWVSVGKNPLGRLLPEVTAASLSVFVRPITVPAVIETAFVVELRHVN